MDEPVPKLPPELLEKVVTAGLELRTRKLAAAYPWALRVEDRPEEWTVLPRSAWGEGPWIDEPDLVEWRMEGCLYPLLIRRGGMGQLNGYVGVPPEHPFHGRDAGYPGVNHAGPCDEFRAPTGEPPTCWWFGFDCADGYMPYSEGFFLFLASLPGMPPPPKRMSEPSTYVDVKHCRAVVESLAKHLMYWEEALRGMTTRDNPDGTVTLLKPNGEKAVQLPDDVWEGFTKVGR